MKLSPLKPKLALNKAFLKVKPVRSEIEKFKFQLALLLNESNDTESEEFHKNLISDFLKKTYYDPNHFINTKGRNDLVIHNGKKASSSVGVIIEAKKPTNKAEMLRQDNINAKAFHELILYYLRERITNKNLEIKHLIATNIYEWFIFDATFFDKNFAQNKKLVKQFEDFEAGRLSGKTTEFFYKEITEPAIANLKEEIPFAWFSLREFEKIIESPDKKNENKLIALFKLLSPEHLLKLPFTNDSNTLDKRFYSELLHIIGLQETKKGSKKLIGRSTEEERNSASLLENTINQLDSRDKIGRLDHSQQFGTTHQERLFNVALELAITWINRVLFLKLLEAQLITYHKGNKDYAFLTIKKINDFDGLDTLFFQVLARKEDERNNDVRQAFKMVPYLNSSLFEPTELEHQALFISNLSDTKKLPILSATVLKDDTGKKRSGELPALDYLFSFLDAYDFAGEGSEEIQEDNKPLINGSVLGLIFEKINGYKEGSFFTPGFITMYMCRETIRRAVVQKFNETKGWHCKNLDDLYDKIDDRNDANRIINSLKICDLAVGSGHFLVSALNEIIAIKNDLKILQDRNGRRLKEYNVEVVNDELIVTDEDGGFFEYNYRSPESRRVQETLFHEKQTIIEQCLFGVDINPNSVNICRLRLWIELLKNAYYTAGNQLETLPNLDINIKCGNSLISRFGLDADLGEALKKSKWNISSYRLAVDTYRNAQDKEQKREMERLIKDIKSDFRSEIARNDKKLKKLSKMKGDLIKLTTQTSMFEMTATEKTAWNKKVDELTASIAKIEAEIEEIKNNKIFENAFEWRFEFPEVLNDEGDFMGFDVVIGNPPYMLLQNLKKGEEIFLKSLYKTAKYKGDTFAVFLELSFGLSKLEGLINMIVPYTWLSIEQHFELRKLILSSGLEIIIDLPQKVFENADLDTTIILISKGFVNDNFLIGITENEKILIKSYGSKSYFKLNDYWQLNLGINNNEIPILKKIKKKSVPLNVKFDVSQGYIPYRRTDLVKKFGEEEGNKIVDERLWHTNYKKSEDYKQEIQGRDLNRYAYRESHQYVKYGKHLAGYVDLKYFTNPRVLVMEVTRGDYYRVTAAYVEKEFYNTPSIINLIHPENDTKSLFFLLGLINSRLFTWFHLKEHSKSHARTSIPKILVRELKNFPLREFDRHQKNKMISKVENVIEINQNPAADTTTLEKEIDQMVYALYGLTEEEIGIVEGE